ncbi:MAG: hypothetical protein EKK54_01865 [Neisseriaceae bacterium]|nr:MAG: hypothetical protein EKK54_01865 [Neisseriaceae bacterium]
MQKSLKICVSAVIVGLFTTNVAFAADQYMVKLDNLSFKPVKPGPNLSGQDGCESGFTDKLLGDLKADPIAAKISLKYNAKYAEIDSSSYKFTLGNSKGKNLYVADNYKEGLLLGPYRFIEVTGNKSGESSTLIKINGNDYKVSDIWFSAVCLDQKSCQKYVNMSVGFVNPKEDKAICYVYNKPYIPGKVKQTKVLTQDKNLGTINARRGNMAQACSQQDATGQCLK